LSGRQKYFVTNSADSFSKEWREQIMDAETLCQNCQAPLAADAPRGLCPACLMKVAMATATAGGQKKPGFTPPAIEELARNFPQLEIIELIGRGGMGAVYKARQRELDRIVALKILPPGIGDDAAFAERFTREAKALARLNHPGIVTIHDSGRAGGLYFFVMEFVDGVDLRQLLSAGRVHPREALAIVPQICDALQFAHDQGIVHRDIKPENILLDRRGRVKVADFGLAKIIATGTSAFVEADTPSPSDGIQAPVLTEGGKVMGTPAYMAPEQLRHPDEVDHRADIYALGVVFYQMLTGELPGKRIEPPSRKVHIDVRLDEVVLRALEAKPELRYQQVNEVKTATETIAATESASLSAASGKSGMNTTDMKGYVSSQWNFALDIPRRWNSFPPVSTNSPDEVIRFASYEEGSHILIIFRSSHNPGQSQKEHSDQVQQVLAGIGFGNFSTAEAVLRSGAALMLDFDRPRGDGTWSCRHYFLAGGAVRYTLGFGTSNKADMFDLFDRMAKSFEILSESPSPSPAPSQQVNEVKTVTETVAATVPTSTTGSILRQPSVFRLPDGPVELKFKWPPPGKQFVFHQEYAGTIDRSPADQPGQMQYDAGMKYEVSEGKQFAFTVLKESPEGGHEVELEILATRLRMGSGVLRFDYDFTKKYSNVTTPFPKKPDPAADLFGKIVGSKIRYFLDADNEIQRMEGLDELLDRLKPASATRLHESILKMIRSAFNESWFRHLPRLYRFLPLRMVQMGEAWLDQRPFPAGKTMGIVKGIIKSPFKAG
jgi:serine/threonine protein kinase